jgi:hypothetical protein
MIFEFKLQRALRPLEVGRTGKARTASHHGVASDAVGDRSARAKQGDLTCCDGSGGRSRNPMSAWTNSALRPPHPSP